MSSFDGIFCLPILEKESIKMISVRKRRKISDNSTTTWFFGNRKTSSSNRVVNIGDTLLIARKEYKEEQILHRKRGYFEL